MFGALPKNLLHLRYEVPIPSQLATVDGITNERPLALWNRFTDEAQIPFGLRCGAGK